MGVGSQTEIINREKTLLSKVFFCIPSRTDCIGKDALGSR